MPEQECKPEVVPQIFETYLTVIKNSLGSNLFRNFFAKIDGQPTDIMRNGELSCAFFVSSVLALFKFIKESHATVDSTVKDLRESGWMPINSPEAGSILVWERVDFGDNDIHKHIGFFIGDGEAVSNNYKLGYPTKHSWDFDGTRKVDLILWKPAIQNNPKPSNETA